MVHRSRLQYHYRQPTVNIKDTQGARAQLINTFPTSYVTNFCQYHITTCITMGRITEKIIPSKVDPYPKSGKFKNKKDNIF